MYINISSLLTKIDKLRYIASSSNAAVIWITKTISDKTVYDSEVAVDGYNIVQNYKNRKGGGVACYIINNICFNSKACISGNTENIFIDLLFLKTKSISVGYIYKPLSQNQFLELMIKDFEALNHNNEIYILGDFNVNLLFLDKYALSMPNETKTIDKDLLPEIKRYKKFCSMYGLSQLIDCPTRITYSISTLKDHILTNTQEKISQLGVIDTAISYHSLIYSTRKIPKPKNNRHNLPLFKKLLGWYA